MGSKKNRAVYKTCQDAKETEVSRRDFVTVRLKIFNLHSLRLVKIVKVKTVSSQTTICELKIHTGNDGNLIPIRMFKLLFLDTKIADLNKSIGKIKSNVMCI